MARRKSRARTRGGKGLPLALYLLRRTRYRRAALLLLVLLAVGLFIADRQGLLLVQGDDLARYDNRTFRVDRVIDGDTLAIDAPDGDDPITRIRLWGIDTPEHAHPNLGVAEEPFAREATRLAQNLVLDVQVRLTLEPHRVRGSFGRVLAFVELPDGRVLNEELLKAGLARADDRWRHRHLDRYLALEAEAKRRGAGMWGARQEVGVQESRSSGVEEFRRSDVAISELLNF